MKKLFLIAAVGVVCVFNAVATLSPFYQTLSAGGNATAGAELDFISSPGLQARLVSVNYQSDTNNAVLSISTGGTAYSITATNAASTSTTNQVNSTNGLAAGTVFLEHGGKAYVATLSSYSNTGTNVLNGGTTTNVSYIVLASGGFGVSTSVGDSLYLMGTATSIPIGAATNWINGEAIYIGNTGRPLRAVLTPSLSTNNATATVRFE